MNILGLLKPNKKDNKNDLRWKKLVIKFESRYIELLSFNQSNWAAKAPGKTNLL